MKTGIGQRIRELRGDMNQRDFGSQFSGHTNTIGRYESEESSPKADFLLALYDEFHITGEQIF